MEWLPIGSVVLLKDWDKRSMIYGIKQFNEEKNQSYDYEWIKGSTNTY